MTTTVSATAADVPHAQQPLVQSIAISRITESPTNPRKIFGELGELVEGIRAHGILQPLLARPKGKAYELVFGHRRLRAAKVAGIAEVPVMVRELDDETALEMQLIENAQREDIHPLEEADGYEVLHTKHGYSVDEIAAKVGKSRASVYARMKLLELCPAARKAFYEGRLSPSTALLVARIPSPKLQLEAIEEIAGDPESKNEYDRDNMGAREAAAVIQQRFMLRLVDAPFSTSLDGLGGVGPCTTCPKRTGNQAELFADVKSADVCTDLACFDKKVDAEWKARIARSKDAGQRVLTKEEAKKAFPHSYQTTPAGEWVDLDQTRYDYSGGKSKTYRELLKKEAPVPVLARDTNGKIRELLPKKQAEALCRKLHPEKSERANGQSEKGRAKAKAEEASYAAERERANAKRSKLLGAIGKAAVEREPHVDFWRAAILEGALGGGLFLQEEFESALERRGILDQGKGVDPDEVLEKHLAGADVKELRGLLVELIAGSDTRLFETAKKALGVKA